MSEENEVKNYDGSNEFVDYFLADLIATANQNFDANEEGFTPATISVNGTIYSGFIIGGAAWCDLSIKQMEAAAVSEEVAQGVREYFTKIKEQLYTEEAAKKIEDKDKFPAYLHMLVKTTLPNERTINKLWRFKACEVEGVSLGYLR
ncbi:hypothetical protein ACIPUA_19760 [Providencia sp. AGC89]